MGVMYGRWPCTWSSFFPTTCPNNAVCLTQGCFPGGSASIAKWTRRQSRTVEQKYDFYFISFSARSKQAAGVVLQCRTGVSACHCLQPGLQKPINICDESIAAACMHLPPFLLGLVWDRTMTCDTLLEICSYLQAPQRDRLMVALFFKIFLLSIAQRIGSKPPPSHMKVLSFVRDVWTFEMTPKHQRAISTVDNRAVSDCWSSSVQCRYWGQTSSTKINEYLSPPG